MGYWDVDAILVAEESKVFRVVNLILAGGYDGERKNEVKLAGGPRGVCYVSV